MTGRLGPYNHQKMITVASLKAEKFLNHRNSLLERAGWCGVKTRFAMQKQTVILGPKQTKSLPPTIKLKEKGNYEAPQEGSLLR